MVKGIPVVIVESKGVPVIPVDGNAPLMTVAANGKGLPITLVEKNAPPFVLQDTQGEVIEGSFI